MSSTAEPKKPEKKTFDQVWVEALAIIRAAFPSDRQRHVQRITHDLRHFVRTPHLESGTDE